MDVDLKIPVLEDWHSEKMKEDLKIPFQNSRSGQRPGEVIISGETKEKIIVLVVLLFIPCLWFFHGVSEFVDVGDHMTTYKPEIGVESVYVCPISLPNSKIVVWNLRFDIRNLNNYTLLCLERSEASLFSSYNQNRSELLAKGEGYFRRTCVEPLSHTSMDMTFIAEEPNHLDWGNGSIRFDLKLRSRFMHNYHDNLAICYKMGDVVCRDAKLAFLASSSSSSSSNSSSCGAMISDPPPRCSFESYYEPRRLD